MSFTLKPNDKVIFRTRIGDRSGLFVRYVEPKLWPPNPDMREYCLIKTRHSFNPVKVKIDLVRKEKDVLKEEHENVSR